MRSAGLELENSQPESLGFSWRGSRAQNEAGSQASLLHGSATSPCCPSASSSTKWVWQERPFRVPLTVECSKRYRALGPGAFPLANLSTLKLGFRIRAKGVSLEDRAAGKKAAAMSCLQPICPGCRCVPRTVIRRTCWVRNYCPREEPPGSCPLWELPIITPSFNPQLPNGPCVLDMVAGTENTAMGKAEMQSLPWGSTRAERTS